MKGLLKPTGEELLDAAIDITAPEFVEMKTDGKVVWVNVDGVCVLRVCRAKIIVVNDEARYRTYKTPKGGE